MEHKQSKREFLFIGIVTGIILGVPLVMYSLDFFSNKIFEIAFLYLLALLLFSLIIIVITYFRSRILEKIFRSTTSNVEEVAHQVIQLSNAIVNAQRDQIIGNSQSLVKKFATWYSWVTFRNWMIQTLIAIVFAFAGLVGTILLFKQNKLIEEERDLLTLQNDLVRVQNEQIRTQSFLLESDRRAGLIIELTSILEFLSQNAVKDSISKVLEGRIIALSRSFRPYFYLDNQGELIESALSPERSQLLIALLNTGINYDGLFTESDFQYADLQSADIDNNRLVNINLSYSNLNKVKCSSCNFTNAALVEANLTQGAFSPINFDFFTPDGAIFKNAVFYKSILDGADFQHCLFQGTEMMESVCNRGDFRGAEFVEADLRGAKFIECGLQGATFYKCNMEGVDLSNSLVSEKDWLDNIITRDSCMGINRDLWNVVPEDNYFRIIPTGKIPDFKLEYEYEFRRDKGAPDSKMIRFYE